LGMHSPKVPHPDFSVKVIGHNLKILWLWKTSEAEKALGVRCSCPCVQSRRAECELKNLLIPAAGMPSLENHEGWGNRFVVLHEAAKLGHLLVESQRKPPLVRKMYALCRQRGDSRRTTWILRSAKGAALRMRMGMHENEAALRINSGDARKRRGLGRVPARSMLIRVSPWWMKFFFPRLCGEKRGRVVATLHFLRRVGIREGGGVVSLPKKDSRFR
jgi:hypothetical protein